MMDRNKSILEIIQNFYAYNSWSMEQLFTALNQLTEENLAAPGCSGHGSIRETLAHLIGAQWGWFSWFDKSKTAVESITLKLTADDINTPEKLNEKWSAINQQTNACIEKLTEDNLKEIWSASFPNGFSIALPFWKLLLHVANHGTHTRAQIVAAIRRFGHNPGNYDYFRFALGQQQ